MNASQTYEYDRAYLEKAIPACDANNVGDGTETEREEFAEQFNLVLDAIRAGFQPEQAGFSEIEVTEVVHIAGEAWNEFCGRGGSAESTIAWLGERWGIRT